MKIYAYSELNLPKIELSGNNAKELLEPYLELVPLTKECKSYEGKLRDRFITLSFDVKNYFKRGNQYHNLSCFAVYLVQTNKATWLEYNADDLNPKLALKNTRSSNSYYTKTNEIIQKRTQTMKNKFANMTVEEKQRYFANHDTTAARAKVAQDIANMTTAERNKYFNRSSRKQENKEEK